MTTTSTVEPDPASVTRRRTGARRICHVTSVHSLDDVRIVMKEARSLAEAGYEVWVVGTGGRKAGGGAVGFVEVDRLTGGRVRRVIGHVSRVVRAALSVDAELYHLHDPELLPWVGVFKARGARVVYDVHEDAPAQVLHKHWIPAPVRRPVSWVVGVVETLGARVADGIVAATPEIGERFAGDKTVIVQNFPMLAELAETSANPYGDRPADFAYVGYVFETRGPQALVDAIGRLKPRGARLRIAGAIDPPSLREKLERLSGWECVDFHGWVDRPGIAKLLGEVRAGLVVHRPVPNEIAARPVKLFEYMAAGLPVIAADFPAIREIVGRFNCGLLVDPLRVEQIAAAMEWVLDHPAEARAMGMRGQRAVTESLHWEAEREKLFVLYDRLFR